MFVLQCLCNHIGILRKRISTGNTWRVEHDKSFFLGCYVYAFAKHLHLVLFIFFSSAHDQNLIAEHTGKPGSTLPPQTHSSWWFGPSCYRSWASCQVCISDFSHSVKFQRNQLSFLYSLLLICIHRKCSRVRFCSRLNSLNRGVCM